MPTYSGRCEEHGDFEDIMKVAEYVDAGSLFCPECGEKARTIISAIPTIGAMPSKPLKIDQIGQTFHSEAEKRAYFKRRPDRMLVDPGDSSFTKHRDLAHEKAERQAKRQGFSDIEDRKIRTKREIKRRREIKMGDKKIQVVTSH